MGQKHKWINRFCVFLLCSSMNHSCVCVGDTDTMLLLGMFYSLFALSSSNFNFLPKFALASFLWKRVRSNWNLSTRCRMAWIQLAVNYFFSQIGPKVKKLQPLKITQKYCSKAVCTLNIFFSFTTCREFNMMWKQDYSISDLSNNHLLFQRQTLRTTKT